MDNEKLRKLLSKWNEVSDIQRLAYEFHKETSGDARKLTGSYQHAGSAYGRVAMTMLGENEEFHRYLLWNLWKSNKLQIRKHYASAAREHGQLSRLRNTPYGSSDKAKNVMCWCSLSVEVSKGRRLRSIRCSQCHEYFHTLCAGLDDETDANSMENYMCVVCSNTPKIPRIFREPFRDQEALRQRVLEGPPGSTKIDFTPSRPKGKNIFKGFSLFARRKEKERENDRTINHGLEPSPTNSTHSSSHSSLRTPSEASGYTPLGTPLRTSTQPSPFTQEDVLVIGDGISGDDFGVSQTSVIHPKGLRCVQNFEEDMSEDGSLCSLDSEITTSGLQPKKPQQSPLFETDNPGSRRTNASSDETEEDIRVAFRNDDTNDKNTKLNPAKRTSGVFDDENSSDDCIKIDPEVCKPRKKSKSTAKSSEDEYVPETENWSEESDVEENEDTVRSSKPLVGQDAKKRIETAGIPREWIRPLSVEEFGDLLTLKNDKFLVTEDHGDALQRFLSERNPLCVQTVGKTLLTQYGDKLFGKKDFFIVYTHCKGPHCRVLHVFTIVKQPEEINDGIELIIRKGKGPIRHFFGEEIKRPLKGKRRIEVKAKLMHELPSNFHRKTYTKEATSKAEKGNYDDVKTLKIYQQARVEAKKDTDFHDDVVSDLIITKKYFELEYKSADLPGYIQEISLFPFITVLYGEDSFRLLRKLSRSQSIPLFLDATSCIAKAIADFDKKRIFYYALVVKAKQPVPILEFFSSKQNFVTIQYALECFFQRYKTLYDIKSFNYNVSRIEIDFSLASLAAVTRVFLGQDSDQFMKMIWRSLLERRTINFCIHICRVHTMRFLDRHIKKCYTSKTLVDDVGTILTAWSYRLVSTKTMTHLSRNLEFIILLVGSKFKTQDVEEIIEDPESFVGARSEMWRTFNIDNLRPNDAFYLRSPFGAFCNQMIGSIENSNKEIQDSDNHAGLQKNKFYNPRMLKYIQRNLAPYAPLMSQIPFLLSNQPIQDDTTNPVESWMKVFKKDILENERYQKITRVIRTLSVQTIGQVRKESAKIPSVVETRPNSDQQSDSDISESHPHTSHQSGIHRNTVESPDKSRDEFKKQRHRVSEKSGTILKSMELITAGGSYDGVRYANTCALDCTLQSLYFVYNFTKVGRTFIDAKMKGQNKGMEPNLRKIFDLISAKRYSEAKFIYIWKILDGLPGVTLEVKRGVLDLWDEDKHLGLKAFKHWFPIVQRVVCQNANCDTHKQSPKRRSSYNLYPKTQDHFLDLMEHGVADNCGTCNAKHARYYYNGVLDYDYSIFAYSHDSYFKRYEMKGKKYELVESRPVFSEPELTLGMQIFGKQYKVICYITYNGSHYKLVIIQGNRRLCYDDRIPSKGLQPLVVPDMRAAVTTIWLEIDDI